MKFNLPTIDTIVLRCLDPQSQRRFYCDMLGMRRLAHGTVGYGEPEARLEFVQSGGAYSPRPHDRYWKIALAVPNIELACRQLTELNITITEPRQFKDIGYIAHFQDPEGFTIELIDHKFKSERDMKHVDSLLLGGGAHLNLITLRTANIENARRTCIEWGMLPLSIQPVEDYNFTLHFFAFTHEDPPNADLQAIENRPWLYQRPYTILELQELHGKPTIETGNRDCAGYSGFTIRDGDDITEISCDIDL